MWLKINPGIFGDFSNMIWNFNTKFYTFMCRLKFDWLQQRVKWFAAHNSEIPSWLRRFADMLQAGPMAFCSSNGKLILPASMRKHVLQSLLQKVNMALKIASRWRVALSTGREEHRRHRSVVYRPLRSTSPSTEQLFCITKFQNVLGRKSTLRWTTESDDSKTTVRLLTVEMCYNSNNNNQT